MQTNEELFADDLEGMFSDWKEAKFRWEGTDYRCLTSGASVGGSLVEGGMMGSYPETLLGFLSELNGREIPHLAVIEWQGKKRKVDKFARSADDVHFTIDLDNTLR